MKNVGWRMENGAKEGIGIDLRCLEEGAM